MEDWPVWAAGEANLRAGKDGSGRGLASGVEGKTSTSGISSKKSWVNLWIDFA